ncbi:MAG: SPFH domain-containing protein [Planctomycetaceae bacterium]
MLATTYRQFVIDVPAGHMAVLLRKTGTDLPPDAEIALDPRHKGIQPEVLREGRYFFQYNPYDWSWEVLPQVVVPNGKMGVRVRLAGDDLPPGELLAKTEAQKGIVPGVLQPGRHYLNPYLYRVEIHDPVVVPAGFKGVRTNLVGTIPTATDYWEDPQDPHHRLLLVKPGFRGVEQATFDPGTYYLNPYEVAVSLVDCRNQRFNLSETRDLGFPSKDGFWVSLDSIVEFRVRPDMAAKVYQLYNEAANGSQVDEEVMRKVILPAARSFCRLQGSNNSGRDFIQGRTHFQENYQVSMREACDPLGVEIVQALITKINPPQQIARPVQQREIAKQQSEQFTQQILQQKSEVKLAIEKELVKQKQALVTAEQEVVRATTEAKREQQVAVTKGEEKLAVAKLLLEAAEDEAAAAKARGEGVAEVLSQKNAAEATGWRQSVAAFDGDGQRFAQYVLYQKLAGAYRQLMINTADSPLMEIFQQFTPGDAPRAVGPRSDAGVVRGPRSPRPPVRPTARPGVESNSQPSRPAAPTDRGGEPPAAEPGPAE